MSNNLQDIVNFILENVAILTKSDRSLLTADTHLGSVGVDSLNAVLLCGKLEDEYDLEIEPITMFQYKTANEVAGAISKMHSDV